MSNRRDIDLDDMKSNLLEIVSNLSSLMDVEYKLLQTNDRQSNEDMKLVVHDKRNLAEEYAAYCEDFKSLSSEMKEELSLFADEYRDLLEQFREKMQRNLILIEARYKHSELLMKAVLDESRELGQGTGAYNGYALCDRASVTQLGQHLLG